MKILNLSWRVKRDINITTFLFLFLFFYFYFKVSGTHPILIGLSSPKSNLLIKRLGLWTTKLIYKWQTKIARNSNHYITAFNYLCSDPINLARSPWTMYIYIYIYIYVCVCVCDCLVANTNKKKRSLWITFIPQIMSNSPQLEMDTAEELDIGIVGAGICGLTTALALHRYLFLFLFAWQKQIDHHWSAIYALSVMEKKEGFAVERFATENNFLMSWSLDQVVVISVNVICMQEGHKKRGFGKIRDTASFWRRHCHFDKRLACTWSARYRPKA